MFAFGAADLARSWLLPFDLGSVGGDPETVRVVVDVVSALPEGTGRD